MHEIRQYSRLPYVTNIFFLFYKFSYSCLFSEQISLPSTSTGEVVTSTPLKEKAKFRIELIRKSSVVCVCLSVCLSVCLYVCVYVCSKQGAYVIVTLVNFPCDPVIL